MGIKTHQIKPEMADALEARLATAQWLGGAQPSAEDREAVEQFGDAPNPVSHPNLFAWYCLASKFTPAVRATWAGAKAAAPAKGGKKEAPKKQEPKKEEKKTPAADD